MQEIKQNILPIKGRIIDYISAEGMKPAEFYRKSGITRGVLSQPNGLSEENLLKFFLCFPEANPDWIISGRGDRKRTKTAINDCAAGLRESPAESFLTGKVVQLKEESEIFRKRNEELAGEVALLRHELQRLQSLIDDSSHDRMA